MVSDDVLKAKGFTSTDGQSWSLPQAYPEDWAALLNEVCDSCLLAQRAWQCSLCLQLCTASCRLTVSPAALLEGCAVLRCSHLCYC
jgi:hypothetical protein